MIHRIISRLNYFFTLCGCVMLGYIASFILVDVMGRKFYYPIPASVEIVKALMPATIILAFAYVQEQRRNISIDIIAMHFHPRVQAIIEMIGWIMGLLVAGIIFWQGIHFTIDAYKGHQIVEIVNIPLFLFKMFLIPGGALLALQFLIDISDSIRKVKESWK